MVYYAHSKRIYDTKREKQELSFLKKLFKDTPVVCPNNDMGERGSIHPYIKMINNCHTVVCSEYNKHIGFGVYQEVAHALKEKKKVVCLREKKLVPVASVREVDINDWAVKYGKIVTRT